ncbi:hypothetical protein K0817_016370 [Microbacterium sp. HD4P20]|uniref:hypothetical protein n=1 Tax=Microbacterium sp. HD4P20 TaxID=2864874 RepID=UPI001C640D79|nr:hypothetical protein [Microbacterium sp. HD4P20]MCP2638129.1 hypothetical protein [Microbacterium sp. HD4P20]
MRAHSVLGIRAFGLVAATAVALSLAACAPGGDEFATGDARPLTTEEAQTLAAMRLRNLDAGTRTVAFDLGTASDLAFDGWFDYESGVGYGLAAGEPDELLLWNTHVVGSHPATTDAAPLPIPDVNQLATAWQGSPLDPAASRLDTVLATIGSLGADRPENPLLLQQNGTLWLGERTVDGIDLTVYAGPPSDEALAADETADPDAATVRYWIDDRATLHRLDLRLGGEQAWTTVTFGAADDVTLGDPFAEAETATDTDTDTTDGDAG